MEFIIYLPFIFSILFLGFIIWLINTKRGKGVAGELVTRDFLNTLNPKEYKTINDLYIENGNKTAQIDHLVISKYGIFVIETKNWIEHLTGNITDYYWKNKGGYNKKNVSHQNYGHVMRIKEITNLPNEKFISITAFSGFTLLKINGQRYNTYVINISKLLDVICSYKQMILTDNEVEETYNKLLSFQKEKKALVKLHSKNIKKYNSKHR